MTGNFEIFWERLNWERASGHTPPRRVGQTANGQRPEPEPEAGSGRLETWSETDVLAVFDRRCPHQQHFHGHLVKSTRYKGIFLKKTCEPAGVWLKLRKQDKTEQATVSNWPKSGGPQMLQTQQNLTKSMLGLSSRQRQASNTRWAAEIYSGKS